MEKNKVDWTLIQECKSQAIDRLFGVYKKDPLKARVLYFNEPKLYISNRLVLFKRPNGDFEFSYFEKKVGISVTNRIYSRETKVQSLIYKGNKFYYTNKNNKSSAITQLTYNGLKSFIGTFSDWIGISTHPVMDFFIKKFSWIRFISEERLLHVVAFNVIVKNGLYSQNSALKWKLKTTIPVIKILKEYLKEHSGPDAFRIWKDMSAYLINTESLTLDLIKHHLFADSCKMAKTLGRKVNCSWSIKRLTQEHNDWSKEIADTILEFEDERVLRVNEIFLKFADFSGYHILTTNKDILREGMMQRHCVATYISKVDERRSGIYHINGYTLELAFNNIYINHDYREENKTSNKYLSNIQFSGYYNSSAPIKLEIEVNEMISSFNKVLAENLYADKKDIDKLSKISGMRINNGINWANLLITAENN